jgi:hypothetical protein
MIRVFLPVAAAFFTGACTVPVLAQDASPEGIDEALAYAWSNSMYTMYHEVGHMFVDQFAIPVLSKEEDAADNLATLMVLEDYTENGDRILEDAAYGWSLSAAWSSEMGDADFYDTHSLDQQRAFAMVCLLVGSDKATFGEVATDWGLDDERQDSCAWDYDQARVSWEEVLEPHLVDVEAEIEPMIEIVYEAPEEGYEDLAAYIEEYGILEVVAARVEAQYALPNAMTFRAAMCGEDNAYYDPSVPEVLLCYEHAQGHFETYLADMLTWQDAEEELEEEWEEGDEWVDEEVE